MENYINQIPFTQVLVYLFIGGIFHFVFKIINTYFVPLQTERNANQNKLWERIQIIIWVLFSLLFFSELFLASPYLTLSLTMITLGLGWNYWQNIFAGILLKFNTNFKVGDNIQTAFTSGKIIHIALSYSKLKNLKGEFISIPNYVLKKEAVKYLHEKQHLKTYTFTTSSKLKKSQSAILQASLNCPYIAVNQEIKIKNTKSGGYKIKASLIDQSFKEKVITYFKEL